MTIAHNPTSMIGNRYEINRLVGTGGMSIVYKARDVVLDRDVAIKVLRQKYASTEDMRLRFQQEARAAAKLSHPNIVTVFDSGLDGTRIFIALQYIEGSNLKTHIQTRPSINMITELDYGIQICRAIDHAHANKIIHCDIKPSNILLDESNQVKITDFGLARVMQQSDNFDNEFFWGSPYYVSPEQAKGEPPSIASDIYSCGIVLYQLFTGYLPFTAATVDELLQAHIQVTPQPPTEINPDIPDTLNSLILRCLEKDPRKRFRSFSQLRDNLASVRHSLILSLTAEPIESRPNKLTLAESIRTANPPSSKHKYTLPEKTPKQFDWISILLGLLATIAVAGLIPFWIYVYFNVPG